MVIYEWPGKFALVTEQRCGSSLLNNISSNDIESSPLKEVDFGRMTDELNKTEQLTNWLSKCKETGTPIYVLSRDLHHKRSSAVNMKTQGRGSLKDQIFFLQGYISSHIEQRSNEVDKMGFYNFCLNDSHLDWGTSMYYHFLKSMGAHDLSVLWLNRPTVLESNTDLRHLTHFLLTNFKDCPEVYSVINAEAQKLKRNYDAISGGMAPAVDGGPRLGMSYGETSRIVINEAYNKRFRELTDHRDDILKFSDWIWCEQFMNNTMVDMTTQTGHTCPHTSSEVIDIVKKKLEIIDMDEVIKNEVNGNLIWYPGRRFNLWCDDRYLDTY